MPVCNLHAKSIIHIRKSTRQYHFQIVLKILVERAAASAVGDVTLFSLVWHCMHVYLSVSEKISKSSRILDVTVRNERQNWANEKKKK